MPHRDYDVKVGGRQFRLRLSEEGEGSFSIEVGGRRLRARISGEPGKGEFKLKLGGREYPVLVSRSGSLVEVRVAGRSFKVELKPARPTARGLTAVTPADAGPPSATPGARQVRAAPAVGHVKGAVMSPMPGKVVALKVRPGDEVKEGDTLLVIEAMKMENEIKAPRDGRVREVLVQEGATVSTGQPLVVLD